MKTKSVLLWAVFLFVVDQMFKVVIDRYFLDVQFDIIPPLFYFNPTFNHQYSWINGLFGLGMGFGAHVIILGFVAIIYVLLYDFMKTISGNRKIVSIAFVFGFAAAMSSFIGTIVWNGCLDYIEWKRFAIFDLKDIYANTFVILCLWYCLRYSIQNRKSSLTHKDIIRHYRARFAVFRKKKES